MKSSALKLVTVSTEVGADSSHQVSGSACIGRVVSVGNDAVPLIDFPGNSHGPLVARLALSAADTERLAKQWQDREVLIVFVGHDTRQPVITGLLRNSFDGVEIAECESFERLLFKAEEELVLQCGEAKIVLRRDGKLTIVGKQILSRALERHRIRGATVDIN